MGHLGQVDRRIMASEVVVASPHTVEVRRAYIVNDSLQCHEHVLLYGLSIVLLQFLEGHVLLHAFLGGRRVEGGLLVGLIDEEEHSQYHYDCDDKPRLHPGTWQDQLINQHTYQGIADQVTQPTSMSQSIKTSPTHMRENLAFKMTETEENTDEDFRRQRQAYLAQRNARKLEAQRAVKKDIGFDSSSDDQPVLAKPVMMKVNFEMDHENTSSCSSREDKFKQARQEYKQQRMARLKEAQQLKKRQFGSSSDDDDWPQLKVQKVKPSFKETQGGISVKQPISPQPKFLEGNHNENMLFKSLDLDKQRHIDNQKVLERAKLKNRSPQKGFQREVFEVQMPSKKGVNVWVQRTLQFKQHSIELSDISVPVYQLSKVKLFFTRTQSGCLKFKLSQGKDKQEIMSAIDHTKGGSFLLDSYYHIFAKIVTLKLQLMGRKMTKSPKSDGGLSERVLMEARMTGKVRKSSFFGGWQQKIGVINSEGLVMYKPGKDKPNAVISYGSVREMWTRFEFDDDYLILKLLHGHSKVELSIPLDNFLSRDNWLYHIYSLAPK